MSSLAADAELAARLVAAAGALAHRMRAGGISADRKTSISDVVTAADLAAEAQIVAALADGAPTTGSWARRAPPAPGQGRTWVIDPVDGTYNFVAGLDWWCSALAPRASGDNLCSARSTTRRAGGRTSVGPSRADGRRRTAARRSSTGPWPSRA